MRNPRNDDLALAVTEPHVPERTCILTRRKGSKDELIQKKRVEPRRRSDAPTRPEDKGGILAEYGLTDEQGNEIIMAARAHWFENEDGAKPQSEEAADAESSK